MVTALKFVTKTVLIIKVIRIEHRSVRKAELNK